MAKPETSWKQSMAWATELMDNKTRDTLHQLRTHLAILQATLEVGQLKGKDLTPQELSQTLKTCAEQVKLVSHILDDMAEEAEPA